MATFAQTPRYAGSHSHRFDSVSDLAKYIRDITEYLPIFVVDYIDYVGIYATNGSDMRQTYNKSDLNHLDDEKVFKAIALLL